MTDLPDRLTRALQGRYTVERRLGGGGMADVFLARDLRHGREVALKVLRPEIGEAIGRERFEREITIAAGLHHPYILPLYDSGEADGLLFYAMPYMREETLRGRLQRAGRLPLPEVFRITRQLAGALDHAHALGVVHRDVKPENVLLLADHALIADFGIARAATARGDAQLTTAGMVLGTPTYMSPEQVFGDRILDGRSDQYSLACVVFEMLAGSPPWSGFTAQAVMARLTTEEVPTLASRVVTVPASVEAAIRRGLAKEPERRFPTVTAFAEALEASVSEPEAQAAGARSLVVLPFANLSDDADAEFLSDGVSEELIHTLSALEGLRVVGRTSAFAFKGKTEDVREIGQRLGVDLVLEGSVRRAGSRLRITAQLTGVRDGLQLWSERFDRTMGDTFAIQDEIAAAILAALRLTILGRGRARARGRTDNPRAHELYLRGRHCWNARTESGLRKSVEYLQAALEADPGFGIAQAGLAESYITMGVYGMEPPERVMPLAETAARAALAADPRLPEGHAVLGGIQALYHWQWGEAAESFRRALAADPASGTMHHAQAVQLLLPLGRWEEAGSALDRARALDPLSPVIALSAGLVPFLRRDAAGAAKIWREVLTGDANFAMAHFFLGQAEALLGQHDQAVASLRRAAELAGETAEITAALGWVLAAAGRQGEAEALLESLDRSTSGRYVSPVLPAQILTALGRRDAAMDQVERAVGGRAADAVWLATRPVFDPLRNEPRFRAALVKVGGRAWEEGGVR